MISTGEKRDTVKAMVRTCRLLRRMNENNPAVRRSELIYYEMLETYYSRLAQAREHKQFIAAHTVFFPAELLYAMDLVPMHSEVSTWMTALFLDYQADLLTAGAELGLNPEICSAHRGLAGAFALQALPRPDVVLWTNLICDNTAKSGELLMKLNDCPGFFLDHPFQHTATEAKYLISEMKDMIRFLEEKSGHKMDWGKLAHIISRTNLEIALLGEIGELRKAVPSPFHNKDSLQLLTIDYMFPGQPEAIAYLEALRDELTEMVRQGQGAALRERYRLMTLFVPPMSLMGFLEKLSQEYGAVSVVEPLFTLWMEGQLDPSRPLESVVQKSYMIPETFNMYGPLGQNTLSNIVQAARNYKVDGAVYYAHIGCRHTCAAVKLIKDTLNDIAIPVLTIDCDIIDPTISPETEVREKLERFFELLEDR
jgi:benzoyl-CoA reductase/2-hydroxyglutaryl-CoA dehydratase subunit BcrC/BadD/HgdB